MTLARSAARSGADIICLSHLRWDFVFQRPNHLMVRAARTRRVFFIEEPTVRGTTAHVEAVVRDGIIIVRPVLPEDLDERQRIVALRQTIDRFLESEGIDRPWLWYYAPTALPWTQHIEAEAVIYDCMDELSGFRFAPVDLIENERRLIARADIVFTGGQSLYEAKRNLHRNTFAFPSSVDAAHFRQARDGLADPADQAPIPRPRIGYFGVIDERIDMELVSEVARRQPEWQFVMLGPTIKISDEDLPRASNIHWLGMKGYTELPAYLGGWDVAIMPFAMNEATRYISPTKTPEYLSGGRPVVSTPIRDVVAPYGHEGLVHIASGADEFALSISTALTCDREDLLRRADRFLATQSWDRTWAQMEQLVNELTQRPQRVPSLQPTPAVPVSAAAHSARSGLPAASDTATRVRTE